MAKKWIGPTLSLLCLCMLATGCATRIQKSMDRSVMIAKRCADIEEAVPNRRDVEGELLNAIALRLIATCHDRKQNCLGSRPGTAPPSPVTSAGNLMASLDQHRTILLSMNQQFLKANKNKVVSLQNEHESLRRDLVQRRDNIASALTALYDELGNAKTMLGDSLSKARACERRTNCVAALGRQLSTIRPALDRKVDDLRQKVQALNTLAQTTQRFAEHTTSFLDQFGVTVIETTATEQQTIKNANDQLKRDTADLVTSSAFLVQRLDAGARTLDSLFSAEVQDAATDLLATKLYGKVADRTVVAIDRLLSQVDRTIDKVDEHAYGAATLGVYLFEDEMQKKFDQVFTAHVSDRLPDSSKTAKLAFAAAACKRLAPDDDNETKNGSLFSPFVFATLIRMQVDLEGGTRTAETVRKEWEQSLNGSDSQSVEAELKSDAVFLSLVAEAYRADSSPSGAEPRAPSILQQVALCTNVEQQLASEQELNPTDLKGRSWAVCGKAVMSATLMGQGLPDAANPVLAQQSIERAKSVLSMPTSPPMADDAAAWRRAMESVLAASVPKQASHLGRLCQRIGSGATATRCETNEAGDSVTLDFDASFAKGKAEDRALELQIARLADMLGEDWKSYVITVYGYASASAYPCGRSSSRTPATCGAEKNFALASARAGWAMNVLRKRLQKPFASHAVGRFNPLSFDTPADRRIRLTVSLQD